MPVVVKVDRPLTLDEIHAALDEDHYIRAIIPCPAGALTNGIDWLNDYADECILPEYCVVGLSDLSYKVVGFDPSQYTDGHIEGLLYLEVCAEVDLTAIESTLASTDDGEEEILHGAGEG
jgi:hypothetical protein